MRTFDVIIVGAGVMGAATACELAREGVNVALIDQSLLPNPRAASVDHSKVFRFAYPDRLYVTLAVDALKRWQSLEEETGARLLTQTGVLLIGKHKPSAETECYDALRSLGLPAEMLDSQAAAAKFPQFNPSAFAYGVFDPSGAILHAQTAVRALIDLAKRLGVVVIEGQRIVTVNQIESRVIVTTESAEQIEGERALIASGPWTRSLVPFLRDTLTTTRQEVVYFEPRANSRPDFEPGRFPIFIELESGFYGFPIHHAGAMKLANHHRGASADPNSTERVEEEFIDRSRAFFQELIPGLADASVRETRVCFYNNTPDDDFLIDWHQEFDRVLISTGFSGHGFKFGPTIGRIAADLLILSETAYDIRRFRLARLSDLN